MPDGVGGPLNVIYRVIVEGFGVKDHECRRSPLIIDERFVHFIFRPPEGNLQCVCPNGGIVLKIVCRQITVQIPSQIVKRIIPVSAVQHNGNIA